MERVLIIGACGQLGAELSVVLASQFGQENVIISDINHPGEMLSGLPFEVLDVLQERTIHEIIESYGITQVYHLAAVLSAKGEQNPRPAWRLNMDGLINVLEACRNSSVKRVFWPSSIAAFGPQTPKVDTPQHTTMDPSTIYGISKLSGELWCNYYFNHYQLDVRSIRYPGLISYQSPPGGGTTDYAVDIFHSAVKGEMFECFLEDHTRLPMMYMPDAVNAAIKLMASSPDLITVRTSYNVSAVNFTPDELSLVIKKHIPDFSISYKPDYRQQIAASWPQGLDDSHARKDWHWQHEYSLEAMAQDMIRHLSVKLKP